MFFPCLIVVGLTGAGKSFSLQWIEANFYAKRVRRYTTRPARADDESHLVVHVERIFSNENDFEYGGWGNTRYCIRASDVLAIREESMWPLIELGDPEDARKCQRQFKPTNIVYLRRNLESNQVAALLKARGFDAKLGNERLVSLAEDLAALEANLMNFDCTISNDQTPNDLFSNWREALTRLGMVVLN